MPPRWPREPDRKTDPEYRRLDDLINFAKSTEWPWLLWVNGIWFGILALHFIYIKAIADYTTIKT